MNEGAGRYVHVHRQRKGIALIPHNMVPQPSAALGSRRYEQRFLAGGSGMAALLGVEPSTPGFKGQIASRGERIKW